LGGWPWSRLSEPDEIETTRTHLLDVIEPLRRMPRLGSASHEQIELPKRQSNPAEEAGIAV
jgi:hypothetical protein